MFTGLGVLAAIAAATFLQASILSALFGGQGSAGVVTRALMLTPTATLAFIAYALISGRARYAEQLFPGEAPDGDPITRRDAQLLGVTFIGVFVFARALPGLIQFVYDRQRDDGGFVEIDPMKRGGTNPTAAAVAILRMLGGLDDPIREDVRQYLREVRTADGGFQANTRIPFADSLSTFTGLLTAQDLGFDDLLDPQRTQAFIRELEFPEGGFRGATWDQAADVGYNFYGLGVLGLLS